MHPSLGYREGQQFYNPKKEHLMIIYAKTRPLKDKPADGMIHSRIGGPSLPYWVDDYQHMKDKDVKHRLNDRNKKKLRMQEQL
jgi:hypothetical protein